MIEEVPNLAPVFIPVVGQLPPEVPGQQVAFPELLLQVIYVMIGKVVGALNTFEAKISVPVELEK